MLGMSKTKTCTKCGVEKKLNTEYFNLISTGPDSFTDLFTKVQHKDVCRLCEAETSQEKAEIRQSSDKPKSDDKFHFSNFSKEVRQLTDL